MLGVFFQVILHDVMNQFYLPQLHWFRLVISLPQTNTAHEICINILLRVFFSVGHVV